MNTWTITNYLQHSAYPGALVGLLLESVVILLLTAGVCLLWRRAAAATRHLTWFVALAGLPVLLCLSVLPHSWPNPFWSVSTDLNSGNEVSLTLTLLPAANPGNSSSDPPPATALYGPSPRSLWQQPLAARFSGHWLAAAVWIWAGGTACGLAFMVFGWIRLRLLGRTAKRLAASDWSTLLGDVRQTLRVRQPVTLLQASESLMPVTWGWWRPVVLLPAEAADWPSQRRRLVLVHELAHVRRRDCLTQMVASLVCALFWLNPLVWLASRRMCVERERACDDLVLNSHYKASDYASELLAIARAFRPARLAAGIAMARSAQLRGRIAALVDPARARRLRPWSAAAIIGSMSALVGCLAGTSGQAARVADRLALRQQQLTQLESFAAAKERQARSLAAKDGESLSPEFQRCFDAALKGDVRTVTNRYEFYKRHHGQYGPDTNGVSLPHTACWQPVLEVCLAFDHLANCEPQYTKLVVDGMLKAIAPGSIYFGGTDPGRGLPTAFEKSSIDADPFFCLTQNALADGTYLDYLRSMYGGKIYTPTAEDSQRCFSEYLGDAQRRLQHDTEFPNEPKQIKPGEDVRKVGDRVEVTGQVAVMSINGLLTKLIFDRNPGREFYVEESFPLEWMYPHLEPAGPIMRINRQPLAELPEAVLARDDAYWRELVSGAVGDWLNNRASVAELTDRVRRVYVQKNLRGFAGDPNFIQNHYAKAMTSKLRSSIAGVYAWRLAASTPAEYRPNTDPSRQQLIQRADLAFRQAFALCPDSPEAVFRYVNFLMQFNRIDDAMLITQTAVDVSQGRNVGGQMRNLLQNLQQMKKR